ncbi:efflux transporter outer membrane subunit [Xanthocytophaga agilis]|uniref:Efflux transporter outer membrane subunit n=1 Tax=Xanthocytophaga agilis TaxID=3048010 RepID=A0AAE3RDD4_9BACT|nr:efflux transporter outer membrane subunit [Xanthocytophaga agilis]MDJ1506329.1 efflux transporter outer membrane subunit [Xanthocytophaga agilis]
MKPYNRYILAIILLIIFLSSCRVGKRYSRPELNIPQQYREQPLSVTADTVLLPWKTFFKDATLVGLIEKALSTNNDVAGAVMNMQQVELSYKQARLGLLPTVDLNVSANRNWLSKNSLNGSLSEQYLGTRYMDDYSATLRLSWEADIWGKARMQKEGALATYFSQKENLSALKTRIIVQVAQAYYNLIALDEQLKVAKRNVELGDTTLGMIQLQYNSALVNSLAVEQAEAQKKTAELLVPMTLQTIAIQENALSILCGSFPDSITRAKSLAAVMPDEVFPSGVPAALLSRRPDVKAMEYMIVSANARTGLAKAALYPTISITPSIGSNSYLFNTWFDLPGSLVKSVGVGLTQPIFQKRSLKAAYDIALIDQQKASAQFRQSVLTAVGEVSDALVRSKYADERIELVEKKKASLTKATNDVMMLYKSAMATYLEVITAQNNALQNELEAITIRRDKLNAITDLYRALGGGVEN